MSMKHLNRQWLSTVAIGALCLWSTPALAQVLTASPACGVAGTTKVCLTGSGWAEPNPPCHYSFFFDGASVAPDQQDGLFGPPLTSFIVPGGAATGNHTIDVKLIQNDNGALLQEKTIPFKVVAAGAGATVTTSVGAAAAGSGESITITYTPSMNCDTSCKKIVFIQTVRRFAVDNTGKEIQTKASDWPGLDPDGKKTALETAAGRRVDQYIGLSSPYYEQNDGLVAAGTNDGTGQVGSAGATTNNASLFDQPDTGPANFPTMLNGSPVTIKSAILRFESAPFCAEGDAAGKFLGKVITWEQHQNNQAGATGTIQNVVVSDGQPSADFSAALQNWDSSPSKNFNLPQPKMSPCQ
jgi:hypothetical protein